MFKRAIPAAVAAIGGLAVAAMMVIPSASATAAPSTAGVGATPTAVTVPPIHAMPDAGGDHCTDGYRGGVGGATVDHICAYIDGTLLNVNGVHYAIQASVFPLTGPAWCGEAEVVATWTGGSRAWVSPHGCSNSGSTKALSFQGTIWTYFHFPNDGSVCVYAISDVGRPQYPGCVKMQIFA